MVTHNINIVRDKIADVCTLCGRNPADIKIIAVSKNTGLSLINQAISAGIKDLGENKAQEFSEKFPLFSDEINWHFIGHLQRNKVKYIVGKAGIIHSVDSIKLAEEINLQAARAGVVQTILIEVKTSGEAEKFGLTDNSAVVNLAKFCSTSKNLNLAGLMTMAPLTDDEKIIAKCFSDLRKLKEELNSTGFKLSELSMGMTNDYEIAIKEGATMLRLGTAIFGERDYSKSWKEQ
ncbi:MAG: YggS family pyridoxal phosphate-dependent enzyme [Ignavibacteriales bacterium]|nr:MAG: YggS family pyridoxal phosphate-dependent enzyme [Ignavibacteriales bacterium]